MFYVVIGLTSHDKRRNPQGNIDKVGGPGLARRRQSTRARTARYSDGGGPRRHPDRYDGAASKHLYRPRGSSKFLALETGSTDKDA